MFTLRCLLGLAFLYKQALRSSKFSEHSRPTASDACQVETFALGCILPFQLHESNAKSSEEDVYPDTELILLMYPAIHI